MLRFPLHTVKNCRGGLFINFSSYEEELEYLIDKVDNPLNNKTWVDMVDELGTNTHPDVLRKSFTGGRYDRYAVDTYIAQGKIKLVPMSDCRGMEICDNEILFITESENTTADLMKICLSRVSSGAKVIIEGDFDQTDDRRFDCENGMNRAIDVLKGEKEFGYVQLQNVWRSRIAELVDKF